MSNFSLQYFCLIIYENHENKGNDHQMNSPSQSQRICTEKIREKIDADVKV